MTTLYYESDMDIIIADIKDYVNQSDDTISQKNTYLNELEAFKNDFEGLVYSGVFHDACGKVLNVYTLSCELVAEVETEY